MLPTVFEVPGLPPGNDTYSQVSMLGDLVYVSGQLGVDPATGRLAEGGVQAQTRQAILNVARCLEAAGSSLERVAKVNLYLVDFASSIGSANVVYAEYFRHRPAKTGVGVASLWGGALVEIEVVAGRSVS
ncbi:reactive intermediate/imine deaminase [Bryobacterales bacterium F-183]|nr:reactive intermediate/imine deaminase [Bryobacterales bacterium F-183]